jgi:hypothetical protein
MEFRTVVSEQISASIFKVTTYSTTLKMEAARFSETVKMTSQHPVIF